MVDVALIHRDNWSGSGWEGYLKTRVKRAHDGDENFWRYAPFDQGDWSKEDITGQGTYSKIYDSVVGQMADTVFSDVLDGGVSIHRIRRELILPRQFGRAGASPLDSAAADANLDLFPAESLVLLSYRSDPITWLKATLMLNGVADSGVNGVSIEPSISGSWEAFALSPAESYLPGQGLVLEVEFKSNGAGKFIGLSEVIAKYRTARGTA